MLFLVHLAVLELEVTRVLSALKFDCVGAKHELLFLQGSMDTIAMLEYDPHVVWRAVRVKFLVFDLSHFSLDTLELFKICGHKCIGSLLKFLNELVIVEAELDVEDVCIGFGQLIVLVCQKLELNRLHHLLLKLKDRNTFVCELTMMIIQELFVDAIR